MKSPGQFAVRGLGKVSVYQSLSASRPVNHVAYLSLKHPATQVLAVALGHRVNAQRRLAQAAALTEWREGFYEALL